MKQDWDVEVLLDLDGERFYDESGFWWKIRAYRVTPNVNIPHGIRYELTLHDKSNKRIMGFDNAHAAQLTSQSKKTGKYRDTITEWDHVHKTKNDKGSAYCFVSAKQLLTDFFERVNEIIEQTGNKK